MTRMGVIFAAVNALIEDKEFAHVLAISDEGAKKLVEYLVRRDVDETDAELLGLAYFAGRMHEGDHTGVVLRRLGSKPW